MPPYIITLPLLFFVGYTTTRILLGPKNGDLVLLTMGVVGGAGATTLVRL
ncbi:MAG TPA: hypothetical protein VFC29_17530 [Candidatus Limnocylindrales bacterium]|nr:hypothetical protein [Candidatus Limnocylindrales bacterium]